MKTLTLLRHAKSAWDVAELCDVDRSLNDKGRRGAEIVGRHWRDETMLFDHVVASPARRVVETVEMVERGYGRALAPLWDRRLYLAAPATLLDVIHELPADADRVLLVAHNPGLQELVLLLVPGAAERRREVAEKYPTATTTELALPVEEWTAVRPGRAILQRFVRPRDLDPTLGPAYA